MADGPAPVGLLPALTVQELCERSLAHRRRVYDELVARTTLLLAHFRGDDGNGLSRRQHDARATSRHRAVADVGEEAAGGHVRLLQPEHRLGQIDEDPVGLGDIVNRDLGPLVEVDDEPRPGVVAGHAAGIGQKRRCRGGNRRRRRGSICLRRHRVPLGPGKRGNRQNQGNGEPAHCHPALTRTQCLQTGVSSTNLAHG